MDGVKGHHLNIALFFAIVVAIFYLFYRLLVPLVSPMIWAVVFAILFYPFYQATLKKVKRPGLAAITVVLMVIILIIGPVLLLGTAFLEQATGALAKLDEMRQNGDFDRFLTNADWWNTIVTRMQPYVDLSHINLKNIIHDTVARLANLLMGQSTWIIANVTKTVFYFALMLFTLYYLLKDGWILMDRIRRLVPLPPDRTAALFKELRGVINATMMTGIGIALLQGFLGGLSFAVLGVPSAIFWGALMAFLSIIPFLGGFVIYIPAGIIMIVSGSPVKGLILLAWGTIVVSQIDNFLRPYLVAGGTSMHPLLLFLTITGGIAMFGMVGLVVGPLIAAVFITIVEVFEYEITPMKNLVVEPGAEPKSPSEITTGPGDLE